MQVEQATEAPVLTTSRPPETRNNNIPNGNGNGAAKFLGWFSIGLGIAEVAFPKRLARAIGTPVKPMTTRLMGLREIGVGVGILAARSPGPWIKARVAGDAVDLALLSNAYGSKSADRVRLAGTTAAVAAISAADIIYARKLNGSEFSQRQIRIESSVAVNRSPEECYRFWRQVENFPRFMKNLKEVHPTGERTSRWQLKAGDLKTLEWNAEITRDTPNETIEWQSLKDADLENSGSVRFQARPSGKGTYVRVAMEYAPPLSDIAAIAPRILEKITVHSLHEDLRRFKSLMECGEIPTTEGQPSGAKASADSGAKTRATGGQIQ
jgi:uncharacterized membrane protein